MNEMSNHRLRELKKEWDVANPLLQETEARLWRKLRLEWNYHSNHIEGNTLTYGETELLLIQGKTTGQHEMREYEEMKAHDVAIEHVRDMASDSRVLSEADVRNLNKILLKEPFWKEAITSDGQVTRKLIIPGQYKTTPNNVRTATGEIFPFASPEEVPSKMGELIVWFRDQLANQDADLARILAAFHHRFSVIHPFDDGNGRTMRLLVNYALLRKGWVPIVIRTQDKHEYLGVLGAADAGNLLPFSEFLTKEMERSLEMGLRAANGESLEEPEDWQKEMALFVKENSLEGDPAPPIDEQLLGEWLKKCIFPLTSEISSKLAPLNKLFHSMEFVVVAVGSYAPARIWNQENLDGNIDWFTQMFPHYISPNLKMRFDLRLKGFSHPGVTPFDHTLSIRLDVGTFRYSIMADGLDAAVSQLRFDRPLVGEQLGGIANSIARGAFNHVRLLKESNTFPAL